MVSLSHVSTSLVVEDVFLLALGTEDLLQSLGCAVAVTANTLEHALTAIKIGVQFAVLDVALVDGSSAGVAERLARDGIPFIYVTGYRQVDFPDPDAPWVSKPATREQMIAAITYAVDSATARGRATV